MRAGAGSSRKAVLASANEACGMTVAHAKPPPAGDTISNRPLQQYLEELCKSYRLSCLKNS